MLDLTYLFDIDRQKGDAKAREHLPADKQYLLLQGGTPDVRPLVLGRLMVVG